MAADNIKPGTIVRAKRAGWDIPPEGKVTEHDIIEPPSWRDGPNDEWVEDAWVEGPLTILDVPASKYIRAHRAYWVGNAAVDPETIRRITTGRRARPAAQNGSRKRSSPGSSRGQRKQKGRR
jgi:hypothetical protein